MFCPIVAIVTIDFLIKCAIIRQVGEPETALGSSERIGLSAPCLIPTSNAVLAQVKTALFVTEIFSPNRIFILNKGSSRR